MQEETKACKDEIELLDMQMLAIAAMHGTKAYEAACRRHLDAKVLIETRLTTARSRLRRAEQQAMEMETTANNISKETKQNRQARQAIRQHSYYTGSGPNIAPKGNSISYMAIYKISNPYNCLLYTSPSPRD